MRSPASLRRFTEPSRNAADAGGKTRNRFNELVDHLKQVALLPREIFSGLEIL